MSAAQMSPPRAFAHLGRVVRAGVVHVQCTPSVETARGTLGPVAVRTYPLDVRATLGSPIVRDNGSGAGAVTASAAVAVSTQAVTAPVSASQRGRSLTRSSRQDSRDRARCQVRNPA